jgi:hypothetical protein
MTMLVIMGIYTLIYAGLSGLLMCTAVALIAAAFIDSFEIVVAISIIFSLFYIYYLRKVLIRFEPFQNQDGPKKIISRVESMEKKHPREPQGVYNPAIEGFEDVQPKAPKEGESAASSSAPTKSVKNEVEVPDIKPEKDEKKSDEDIAKEEVQSASGTLFKNGKMPSEHKSGPIIDSGSTLMKAMESFKPEQITSMTTDTKQLLETQKQLMGMLKTVNPLITEGRQLLDTFSGMFGGKGTGFTL